MSLHKKQKQLLLYCIVTAVITGSIIYFLVSPTSNSKVSVSLGNQEIKTPGSTVQSNEIWMQQINEASKLQKEKIDVLEKLVDKQNIKDSPDEISNLQKEVINLKESLEKQKSFSNDREAEIIDNGYVPLVKHSLNLQGSLHRVGNRIPPGSYVKAVLLSSVDASVGVNVASDPQPVVMRLLSDSILPNNSKSSMKRCHIMGSAVGDISSERVFIRLEKMSCVDNQNIIETDVSGYIAGEDGKNGLQGIVVDRTGRMINSVIFSGLLGGMTSFLQNWASSKNADLISSNLESRGVQNNVLSSDFIKGGAQGALGVFDKLADYYIKRAEQLQPVIQINAGRVVNIVFSKGSNFYTKEQS